MKKFLRTLIMTGLMVLMATSLANAEEQPYYHGDFANDTTGCAKCHVTHAGQAERLLVDGPTQTDFCYFCHGSIGKSPYDAKNGKIDTATGVMPSVAGGFERTFDFDTLSYDETNGGTDANYLSNSSMHGVETYDEDDWIEGVAIPGGTKTLTGEFRCGSCHDPHAGGTYPGTGIMPRLLRTNLPAGNFEATNHADWTFTEVKASENGEFKTKVVTKYGQNVGLWCAGCHDLFNQQAHLAGQNAVLVDGEDKYMHRMNFALSSDGVTSLGTENAIEKLPLANNNYLTCLTCHRAHGTASEVTDGVIFPRAASYLHGDGSNADALQESSVLLREENRDVCYNCHKAATENTPSIQAN